MPLFNWLDTRGAGVLLHPTSLPGEQGVGVLDRNADRFLDFLQACGITHWQICPLGPTGYGDSPYQCFSAFAGNPNLIDLGDLAERGLLTPQEIAPLAELGRDRVDYGEIYRLKPALLGRAAERYFRQGAPALGAEGFAEFKRRNSPWLDAYAAFRALKDHHGGRSWTDWPAALRTHAGTLRSPLLPKLSASCEAHRFSQYAFFSQWQRVRDEAARRGVSIIGDVPIFVAADSADVWANPGLFELDPSSGLQRTAAGVPPDYFSEDGQFWGNPLYAWDRHAADGYAWWTARLKAAFELCDVVRIDHFRGFESYWRVPLPAKTARDGAWVQGPGLGLFRALATALPGARIIAEDLGVVTPAVERLREQSGLPGMAVLQFAFGGDAKNPYLPHNLVPNQVVYPGTHDNDTSAGWYAGAGEKTRDHLRRYLRVDGGEVSWDLIRCSYAAVSRLAVVQMQDILSLGSDSRLNTPAKPDGNWQWRLGPGQLEGLFARTAPYLRDLGGLTGRIR